MERRSSKDTSKPSSRKRWHDAVAALQTLCPVPGHQVQVRRSKMSAFDDGDCRLLKRGHMMVRVNRTIPYPFDLEVLVHEWAHALSWHMEHDRAGSHSPFWGVAYAECYRAVFNPKE